MILSQIEKDNLISSTAPGISLLVHYGFKIQNSIIGLDAAAFMQFISIISGVVFTYFTYKALVILIKDIKSRLAIFLILCTSAIIVLFTGYVETYPLLTAWLAVYIYSVLRFIGTGKSFYATVILFFIGVFWHIWFLAFSPSLLFIINLNIKKISSKLISILACMYVIGIYLGGIFIERTGIPLVLPIIPAESSHYVLFSPAHILDFINQLVIIGPVLSFLTLTLIIAGVKHKFSTELKFLLYASLPSLAIAFLIDPALGAVRDWDLLSIFALPLFLTGSVLFAGVLKSRPNLRYLVFPIILIGMLHTSGFMLNNKNVDKAVDRVVKILLVDPHYQPDYHNGRRNIPFATILSNAYNRQEDGTLFTQKKAEMKDADYSDYLTLANQYYNANDFEKAQYYYSLIPNDLLPQLVFYLTYGESLYRTGRYSEAIKQLKTVSKDTSFAKLNYLLGSAYLGEGNPDSAVKYYDLSYAAQSDTISFLQNTAQNFSYFKYHHYAIGYYKLLYKLKPGLDGLLNEIATTYHSLQQPDSAYKYYSMILEKDPKSYITLLNLSQLYIETDDFDKALMILDRADRLYSRDALILSKIGFVLGRLNRHQEALKNLKLALDIKPDDIGTMHMTASTYYSLDSFHQAIVYWDSILKIDSGFISSYYCEAQCFDRLGENLLAKKKLMNWLRLNPEGKSDRNAQSLLKKYNLLD